VAGGLARLRVLGPVLTLYQTALGVRGALRSRGSREPSGPPVPPAQLRARIGPSQPDLRVFLETGEQHARLIHTLLGRAGSTLETASPILDFGCGCGRVARHWINLDVAFHGCDVNTRMIEWCRQNLPGQFAVNQLEPPLPYMAGQFGLVYAFSVFTHLPERLQGEWLREVGRVLRPGGFLIFSTLGAYYAGFGRLTASERHAFDAGRPIVLFEGHAGQNICSAYHPRIFVEQTLAKGFEYIAYRAGDAEDPQDTHLLRKP
jgi:SAM-dependent methyltransferase